MPVAGAAPSAPATPPFADPTLEERQLANLRILVVDDDLGAREAVADLLEGTGASVRMAASAAAGLVAIEDFRPSVLVCDVAMPDEDGYSFIRRVRALGPGRGGSVAAMALTALAGEADRRRAIEAGFQMHVTKPVDSHRLTHAVALLSHPPLRPSANA
jgi:two-component system, chemotaxis family, CheB/CheR fusion protein